MEFRRELKPSESTRLKARNSEREFYEKVVSDMARKGYSSYIALEILQESRRKRRELLSNSTTSKRSEAYVPHNTYPRYSCMNTRLFVNKKVGIYLILFRY